MERLTNPEIDYSAVGVVDEMRTGTIAAMLCRLAAYEGTGLEPEEIIVGVRPVVRGKWLLDTVYPSGVKKFRCSICGYDRTVHERYEGVFRLNYCPNCGADMREENND